MIGGHTLPMLMRRSQEPPSSGRACSNRDTQPVKRANCLPYLVESSYVRVACRESYSLFGSHCRNPASDALYRLASMHASMQRGFV